jgi:hypothetical protein
MYLVLDLTNGDGYSDPDFQIFKDRKEALDKYAQLIGYNVINENTITESEEGKTLFLSEDMEDNIGVHFIELDDDKNHSVSIQTCYVDDISTESFKDEHSAIEHHNSEALEIVDISEEESNSEYRYVSGDTDDGSKVVLLIFNKK